MWFKATVYSKNYHPKTANHFPLPLSPHSKMKTLQLGILRESKNPPDLRTPLVPDDCRLLLSRFQGLRIVVQPSSFRCYSDDQYRDAGCLISEDLSESRLVLGVKEVDPIQLLPGLAYAFFSHTIKAQPYNRSMMHHMVREGISLYDYELMTDESGRRTVAFGHWAGIVGAWHALRMRGLRNGHGSVPTAAELGSYQGMLDSIPDLPLDAALFLLCGNGRVGQGALQMLQAAGVETFQPEQILEFPDKPWSQIHPKAGLVVLQSKDMVVPKNGGAFVESDYYQTPGDYVSNMAPFLRRADVLINTIYWDPRGPRHFETPDIRHSTFRVSQIADISCDIEGSVPITTRASRIDDPYYGISRSTLSEIAPWDSNGVDIMAVDNLPCELPREASHEFSRALLQHFITPYVEESLSSGLGEPQQSLLSRARLLEQGRLHPNQAHLASYAAL